MSGSWRNWLEGAWRKLDTSIWPICGVAVPQEPSKLTTLQGLTGTLHSKSLLCSTVGGGPLPMPATMKGLPRAPKKPRLNSCFGASSSSSWLNLWSFASSSRCLQALARRSKRMQFRGLMTGRGTERRLVVFAMAEPAKYWLLVIFISRRSEKSNVCCRISTRGRSRRPGLMVCKRFAWRLCSMISSESSNSSSSGVPSF
mmetsp:Transcript_9949/g.21094  ORF Transcript_9949/g.21094 Transcript_9949/m.21094 type:complete len:200 (+) Transcript_9949:953-1552(+)